MLQKSLLNNKPVPKWTRHILIVGVLILFGWLFLYSYLQFHKQVYTGCKLAVEQGYDIPPPLEATCIQVGGHDG